MVVHATAKRDSLVFLLSFGTEQVACASSPQTSLCKEEEEEEDIIMFDSYEKFMKQKGSFSKNNRNASVSGEAPLKVVVIVVMVK